MAILERIVALADETSQELERAESLAREVLAWHEQRGETAAVADVERRLGTIVMFQGRTAEARDLLAEAWSRLRGDGSPEAVRLGAELARAQLMTGDPAAAMSVIEEMLPSAERIVATETISELLASRMWALAALHRPTEAIAVGRGNLQLADQEHFLNAWFRTTMNLSSQLVSVDPRESLAVARAGLDRARRLGYDEWAISLAGNAADAAFWTGDWAAVDETVRAYDPDETYALFGASLLHLGVLIDASRGRFVEAEATLRRADAVVGDSRDPQVRASRELAAAYIGFARGDLATVREAVDARASAESPSNDPFWLVTARASGWAGDVAWAETLLDRALASPRMVPASLEAADARTIRALLDARAGRAGPEAAAASDAAAASQRDVGAAFPLALNRLERAVFLPDFAGAEEAADEARAILERLDARPLLDRLDAAGWTAQRTAASESGDSPAPVASAASDPSGPSS